MTGGLTGKLYALILVQHGIVRMESVSYVMLIGMGAFLVAVVRTPITAIILITEITGHFEVFYPSIVVGGLTYYFTELLGIKPFNVMFYEEMINKPAFREQKRLTLDVEVMAGAYFDRKEVDTLELPKPLHNHEYPPRPQRHLPRPDKPYSPVTSSPSNWTPKI